MTNIPNDLSWRTYALMTMIAFGGVFMRAARWQGLNGQILWSKILVEVPVAFTIGAIGIGIGTYMEFATPITGGIVGLLGLLGPSAVDTILVKYLNIKLGISNGDDNAKH